MLRSPAPYSHSVTAFETERLIARGYSLDDAAGAFELYGDPEVMRFLMGGQPTTSVAEQREKLAAMIERYEAMEPGMGAFAVLDKSDRRILGTAIFRRSKPRSNPTSQEIEIGWHVARRVWGAGYGTEIALGLVAYGFESMAAERLVALIERGNERSSAIARRAGMRFAGTTHDYYEGQGLELWDRTPA